jgi:RHS repeat-associated protein
VCVNTQRPSYYTITGVSGSSLTVEGDLTSPMVAEGGDWFRVIAPHAVDSDTGKLPENPWPDTPRASPYAGYRYMPPEVGTPSGGEVQAGANEKGRYHCFNRDYDPHTGSWITPDPAAGPWSNLNDYVAASPIGGGDPSGLGTKEEAEKDSCYTGCENTRQPKRDGHDRPTSHPRLKMSTRGCKPKIEVFTAISAVPDGYKKGVKEAIQKRIDYLDPSGIEPEPLGYEGSDATGENTGLGHWILRETSTAAALDRKRVGQALAFAVVFSWCCVCDFEKYEHLKKSGDSWVADATEDVEKAHWSASRGVGKDESASDGRCYMARVDSVGNWDMVDSTPWGDASYHVHLKAKGTVKDPVTGTSVSAEHDMGEVGIGNK